MMAKSAFIKASTDTSLPTGKTDKLDKDSPFGRRDRRDPLTMHLGANGYYHKMRWPWFHEIVFGKRYALEVDRYYHDCRDGKLAIDICKNIDPKLKSLKRELLEKNGIKYIVIESAMDLKSFAEMSS